MKEVLILTESTSVPFIAKEVMDLNYQPIFIYSLDNWDIDESYTYETIDFSASSQEIFDFLANKYRNVRGIVNCIEQLTYKMAEIAEKFGVAINDKYSYLLLRDKGLMKAKWEEENVPTPKFYGVFTNSDISHLDLTFPLIVKPVFGAASAGVREVHNMEDLKKQIRNILRFNLTSLGQEKKGKSGFIIEQLVGGKEYSVDTIWIDGKPILSGILSKGTPVGPNFPDRIYYTDSDLSEEIRKRILQTSYDGVRACGVKNGCTHTELRVMDETPYIIEAALRPGAGGALYRILSDALGISFYNYLVAASIPECQQSVNHLKNPSPSPIHRKFWYNAGYQGFGKIKSLEVEEGFLEGNSNITSVTFRKDVGAYLPKEGDSLSYLAWLIGDLPDHIKSESDLTDYMKFMDQNILLSFEGE
ncbi:ATP-grasp domain-containing protein [Streptococcaceae bacterium ESL0687]|nr:ATP-grasp domain-containing protein [Streptococcaceae bacterium ESL0687]